MDKLLYYTAGLILAYIVFAHGKNAISLVNATAQGYALDVKTLQGR